MKKTKISVLCLCMALCMMLCSCGEQAAPKEPENKEAENKAEYTINELYDPENLLSVTGKVIDLDSSEFYDDFSINRGWLMSYTGMFYDYFDGFNYGEGPMWNTYQTIFYYPDVFADRFEEAWEIEDDVEYIAAWNEIYKDAKQHTANLIVFGFVDADDKSKAAEIDNLIKDMDVVDFGTAGGNKYFMAFMKEMPKDEMFTSSDLENMQEILDNRDEILDNFAIFPPVSDAVDFSDFEGVDAEGNTVTPDIFKDYDVTMINIWATWCGPCLNEMSELCRLYDMLPDGANMISFCADCDEDPDSVQDTIDDYQIPFTVIMPDEDLKYKCLPTLIGFPSTVFVDKNGKGLGRIYVCPPTVDSEHYADAYLEFIEDLLAEVK